jgi:hypothetical protein
MQRVHALACIKRPTMIYRTSIYYVSKAAQSGPLVYGKVAMSLPNCICFEQRKYSIL